MQKKIMKVISMKYEWREIAIYDNVNDQLLLTHRGCPICKSNRSKTVFTLENFQFFSDSSNKPKQATVQNQMCEKCFALYMNPCYSKDGFAILFDEAGQSYGASEGRAREQYQWIQKRIEIKEHSSLMDIGCGYGAFLSELPSHIQRVGIDIDQASIDIAREMNKDITFICSDFEDIRYDEKIDIITMFHVLEHLPNPLEILKRLHKIANKNTKLIVEVPILENGLTNDINGFFSVQHLTHFTRNSFKNILGLSGWKIVEWEEQDTYNGCRVLVEKGEVSQKIDLDFDQKTLLYRYLQNWYDSIRSAESKLRKIHTKKCLIWGGGMHLEFLYQISSLFDRDIEFIIVDKDQKKQNKTWRGIKIYDPNIIPEILDEDISFIPSSYRNQEHIKKELLAYGVAESKIVSIYDKVRVY